MKKKGCLSFTPSTIFSTSMSELIRDGTRLAGVKIPGMGRFITHGDNACASDIRRFKLLRNAIYVSAYLHASHRQVVQDKHGRRWLIATDDGSKTSGTPSSSWFHG